MGGSDDVDPIYQPEPAQPEPPATEPAPLEPPATDGGDVDSATAEPPLAPPPPPRRRRLTRRRLGALVLVMAAVVAGATWYLTRSDPLKVTLNGKVLDTPQRVLASAEGKLADLVSRRHGVTSRDTRCYFDRTGGAVSTDVAPNVYCGPVLFYDGTPDAAYLSYTMAYTSSANHHVQASVSVPDATPQVPLPAGIQLERPDGRRPPNGSGGLAAPTPPPGPADVVVAADQSDSYSLSARPKLAVIGSKTVRVTLLSSGYVTDYGPPDAEFSPPRGQRLFAFDIAVGGGDVDLADLNELPIGISVDSGPTRRLPSAPYAVEGNGQVFVAAVPESANSIDLVVNEAHTTQRLSLLSGTPAPGNIAVLRRTNLSDTLGTTGNAVAVVDDGGQLFPVRLNVKVTGAYLHYFVDGKYASATATAPDRALVYVDACYTSPDFVDSTTCHSLRGTDMTLTPLGGQPILGRDVGRNDRGYIVFDVPASFTDGSLTFTGPESSGDGWAMLITTPYSVPIHFAAG